MIFSGNSVHHAGTLALIDSRKSIQLDSNAREPGAAPPPQLALPPEFCALYDVQDRLGAGGMGVVFSARQISTGRLVAIKFLSQLADSEATARFAREGRLLARLSHPSVLRVIDVGSVLGHRYLVMEHLPGGSLRVRLARDGRLTVRAALEIAYPLLEGLAACHAEGIVHRDIKPENVMFDEAGRPVIVDLGIGRLNAELTMLTRTGAVLGTPSYMAPEQWLSDEIGPPADVYSFGAMLFEMIAGRAPFRCSTFLEYFERHCNHPPPRLDELVPTPSGLVAAVAHALEKDPGQRPQNAAALLAELRSASMRRTVSRPPLVDSRALGSDSRSGERSAPPRPRGFVSAVAAAWLAILTALAVTLRSPAPPRPAIVAATPIQAMLPAPARPVPDRAPPGLELDGNRPLPPGALYRVGHTLFRGGGGRVCALSSHGDLLATADNLDEVVIRDAISGQERFRLLAPGEIGGLSFVRGNKALAIQYEGRPLRPGARTVLRDLPPAIELYDVATRARLAAFGTSAASGCASLVGHYAAWRVPRAPGGGRGVWVDLDTGTSSEFALSESALRIALNRRGDRLLVKDTYSGSLLELPGGRVLSTFGSLGGPEKNQPQPPTLALSPDASVAAAWSPLGIELIRLPEGRVRVNHPQPGSSAYTFAPDGRDLLALAHVTGVEERGVVTLGDGAAAPRVLVRALRGAAAWSGDGRRLSFVASTGGAQVLSSAASPITTFFNPGARVLGVSRSARWLLFSDGWQNLVVDLTDGVPPRKFGPVSSYVVGCAFAADDSALVTFCYTGIEHSNTVGVFDLRTLSPRWERSQASFTSIQLSPDGSRVGLCTLKGIVLLDERGATEIAPRAMGLSLFPGLYLDPTFAWVASASASTDAVVRVSDFATSRAAVVSMAAVTVMRRILAFSADGRRMISDPPRDVPLAVSAVPSLSPVARLADVPPRFLRCAAFSPDGSLVAVAFDGGAIRVWNAATGALTHLFEAPADMPVELALNVATDRLVSIAGDRTAVVWRLSAGLMSASRPPASGSP